MKHFFVDKVIIFKMYKFATAEEVRAKFNAELPELNPEDTFRINISTLIIKCCELNTNLPFELMLANLKDANPENYFVALVYCVINRGKPGANRITEWLNKGAWVGKPASSDVISDDVMQSKCLDLDGKPVRVSDVFSCNSDKILGALNLNEYVPVFKPDQQ